MSITPNNVFIQNGDTTTQGRTRNKFACYQSRPNRQNEIFLL